MHRGGKKKKRKWKRQADKEEPDVWKDMDYYTDDVLIKHPGDGGSKVSHHYKQHCLWHRT